jgi:hypothetical protein
MNADSKKSVIPAADDPSISISLIKDPSIRADQASLNDSDLWTYILQQDSHMITQFGIGIVGIGALFVAYIEADPTRFPGLEGIITLIGIAGSFILFWHILETASDFWHYISNLNNGGTNFYKKFENFRMWRNSGLGKIFKCFSITVLMAYFMIMVTFAWFVLLIIFLLNHLCTLWIPGIIIAIILLLVFAYIFSHIKKGAIGESIA